ncbi:hypothetical protein B296_00052767 [Ensete ventricosum]|uniref:Uncharacterized protein n=1 Tax=Ensete ventricosum TaxID=4639 RepID=A0A426XB91_ENSVE|nr:hypothetical protein B296_00052767 [Ensete ventricosum]
MRSYKRSHSIVEGRQPCAKVLDDQSPMDATPLITPWLIEDCVILKHVKP